MEHLELTFRANNQCLEAVSFTPPLFVASNTVDWIVAKFDLGTNWDCWDLGAVKAIWKFKSQQYSAILNAEGECTIPHEVLGAMTGEVKVNLVASTIEDDEVVERLTTYPLYCINVNKVALVDGDNSVAITPSEYEQFVEDVQEYAQDAYNSKVGAEQARDSALESAGIASDMADTATQAKNYAVQQAQLAADAKEAAQTAQGLAESAKDSAIDARDDAIEAKNDAQGYAQDAERASQSILGLQATAEVDANVGTPSVSVSVSEVGGNKVMDFAFHNLKGVQGETGADGEDGADGFSPTVEVTPTTDGNEVTITDKNGEHTFEVLNGNIEDFYPFLPTDTAQGEIASFPDGANQVPMPSLIANINPIQDLHGQSSPYPAGGGKNLLDFDSIFTNGWTNTDGDLTATYNNGVMRVTGTNNTAGWVNIVGYMGYWSSSPPIFGAGDYIMSQNLVIVTKVDGTTANKSSAFSVENTLEVRGFYIAVQSGATVDWSIPMVFTRGTTRPTAYSPYSNICPISGTTEVVVTRGGINQWDEVWEQGTINTSTGQNASSTTKIRSVGYIAVLPNTSYYFKKPSVNDYDYLYFYDSVNGFISSQAIAKNTSGTAFTTPNNCHFLRFVVSQETYGNDVSINYPSTDHDYHSYITPLTITTELGQTVYGGTLDVVSGVLTVDRAMDTITKDSTWYSFSTGTGNSSAVVQLTDYQNVKYVSGIAEYNGAIASTGIEAPNYWVSARQNEVPTQGDMCFAYSETGQLRFHRLDISSLTDLEAFKSSFPDTQIAYYLATPITYQLTPQEVTTLLGGNTVWADSGDVEVAYKADIQRYIDKKISAVLNA